MTGNILSQREIRRYNKQIMIPEIGIRGQEKLKLARILVVGAGGLGCPVLQYLAAAGVGNIAITESDLVDESDLQRQILYGSSDVGKLKSIIAKNRLEYLNSLGKIEIINLRLDASNSLNILKNFDIIVDATDNPDARIIISDSCVILDKPMVFGTTYEYEGVITVFNYKGGSTYRCYNSSRLNFKFKEEHHAEAGLFGVLPGLTGIYMANEVLKIITDTGDVLSGKVLLINVLKNTFNIFPITNIPENHNISTLGVS